MAGERAIDAARFSNEAAPLRAQSARPLFMVSFQAGSADAPVGFALISADI